MPYNQIQAASTRGVLVIAIASPRLDDYQRCRELGRELLAAYEADAATDVVVDLGSVEYVASVGLMPLLSFNRAVRQAGGKLILCNFSEFVADVFHATRLLINPDSPHSPFSEQPTLAEAIERLAQS